MSGLKGGSHTLALAPIEHRRMETRDDQTRHFLRCPWTLFTEYYSAVAMLL